MRRDCYTCRYCGARIVPAAVLRAVALAWPVYVPYQPNWRTDATHPIFAARATTFDHLQPTQRASAITQWGANPGMSQSGTSHCRKVTPSSVEN